MNDFTSFVRSLGPARIAAIIGSAIGVSAALAFIVFRLGAPPLGVLYADLDYAAAEKATALLEREGVRYEFREAGGRVAVLAPRDRIARLKMRLASEGVTAKNGVGYEIFDNADPIGASTFQQSVNRLRALEGELARTIASIDGVRAARVHLVLPERELFARERKSASASIVVETSRGLDRRAVQAIVNLAATAVPELSPQRITVLDASGELLASGDGAESTLGGRADERTAATEARLRRTVEDLLTRIVGAENLRVQVSADIDFNRVTENAEIIDPDSQTVLSSVVVEEDNGSFEPGAGRAVTVANALPGAVSDRRDGATSSTSRRTEETTNYQISRTVRSEMREQGAIRRLSVAVAVNAGDTPRAPDAMARLDALVKSAIGFNPARGDRVEIVEVAFLSPSEAPALAASPSTTPSITAPSRDEMMRLGEIGSLAAIGLALVFFVLRPMLASGRRAPAVFAAAQTESPAPDEQGALPAPMRALEKKIDLARVEGQVKASSLNKVAEVVRGHSDESAGILKGWIRQTP